ncbi:MAG: hypothetical protein LBI82_01025 [Dysgonamonadaceae bacterium]|jgi:hypothetical protein|nr:hypothetical protein [Dysgonamonadaceae bacterium]
MKKIIILISISIIGIFESRACDLNVDSLFQKHICSLMQNSNDTSSFVVVTERDDLIFITVASLLSGKDFMNPHESKINKKEIAAIKEWYCEKKEYITCYKVKRAYSLVIPPLAKDLDELDKYLKELDEIKIE